MRLLRRVRQDVWEIFCRNDTLPPFPSLPFLSALLQATEPTAIPPLTQVQ